MTAVSHPQTETRPVSSQTLLQLNAEPEANRYQPHEPKVIPDSGRIRRFM